MVFSKIKTILIEEFEIEEADIALDSSFVEDFGFDSIDIYDLVMSCEDVFEKEIPDEALEDIANIGDLVNFISEN